MGMWTKPFPDQLDPSILPIILDAYRGKDVDRDAAFLAAVNTVGFIYGKGFALPLAGAEVPAVEPSSQQVEEAFAVATSPRTGAENTDIAVPWGIILTIAFNLLKKRFGL